MQSHKSFITKFGELIDQHHAEQHSSTEVPARPGRLSRLVKWLLPNGGTLILIALLIATQSVWARNLQSPAAPGPSATTVNYQGRLADSGGTPINGSRAMTFAIYDAASGGNLIWGPETHAAIPVSNGLFSVGLGSQTSGGIPTTAWNSDRYLEITVGGETLSPRELIRSVPIAGMALTVPDGTIGANQIADGAAISSKVALTHGEIFGSGAVLSLTTTPQIVPSLSFSINPTTAQILQWHVTLDAGKSSNCATVLANTYIDNVSVGPVITLGDAPNIRATISTVRQVSLSAGLHTLNIKAYCEVGSGGIIMTGQSSMSYILFSQ
jgi:hypothetical protein